MANIRAGGLIVRLAHTIATAIVLSFVLSLSVAACGGTDPTFNVIGTCTDFSGTLNGQGVGFTPNGSYTTKLTNPKGKAVVGPAGRVSSTGTTPNWHWDCKGDLRGKYVATVIDETTNKRAKATFWVGAS